MTLTSSSQTTKPPTQREKRLALIEVGELATLTVARYPLGLRLPAGPFLSMPAPAAAGKIVLEEKNKHGQQSDGTPSEAQVPCSKQNESTLRAVAGGVGFLGLSGSVPRGSRLRAVPSAHQHQYLNQLAPVLVPGATYRII
jgi:hypothetical protein